MTSLIVTVISVLSKALISLDDKIAESGQILVEDGVDLSGR